MARKSIVKKFDEEKESVLGGNTVIINDDLDKNPEVKTSGFANLREGDKVVSVDALKEESEHVRQMNARVDAIIEEEKNTQVNEEVENVIDLLDEQIKFQQGKQNYQLAAELHKVMLSLCDFRHLFENISDDAKFVIRHCFEDGSLLK